MVSKAKKIKSKADAIKEKVDQVKDVVDKAQTIRDTASDIESIDPNTVTAADIIKITAQIAGLADPTGIAGVVENFSCPLCSQIFK